ncbi:hypothetical protein AAMO2058_001200500 [Amorphochlora amoebiformis]
MAEYVAEGKAGGEEDGRHSDLQIVSLYIYFTELVSAFGDRMWQFSIPILFMDVWPRTLLPTILYTLVLNIAMFVLMPIAGSWVDTLPRLSLMVVTIIVDNLCVVISCMLLYATTYNGQEASTNWILFCLILAVAIPGQLLVNVGKIALEKDWVPVVAATDSGLLTQLNSRLKMIDLTCKFIGPMVFGFILQWLGSDPTVRVRWGSAIVLCYNAVMTMPECICVSRVFAACPNLRTVHKKSKAKKNPWIEFWNGWQLFRRHPIALASLSFALLFTTVLSPGSLLLAYLKWVGVMEGILGASIGFGAICGLLGAYAFPILRGKTNAGERMTLPTIGLFSVWMWFLWLVPIVVVMVLKQLHDVLLSGILMGHIILFFVVVGRTWLWIFDLAENQLLQERVRDEIRGRISGAQTAICQLFVVVIYALGLIFHRPDQFFVLCYTSVLAVLLSAVSFSIWFCRYREPEIYEESLPMVISGKRS